ncbi:thiamine phosphate synthase [Breoghania sp. L-A4]|uniref:thiamine phosphate synthase n=1 Tax=Breoghania sp. L-A4 TaxID=2304600 RepID=UPI000E35D221|nr:thiamine phosphate synthase [Breoghania sp. L-A4]AXS39405.1 thiamine phosphate synthase [Breoghania sp. L-A4]
MAHAFDLSVYLVTDTRLCGARGVVETAVAAARGGATLVQLRDPDASTRQLVDSARALVAALAPFNVPLIVNDRIDVALASGAHGVHVGQSDMRPADVRTLIGRDAILGLSVGSDGELANSDLGPVDYVGIGPVFGTQTKTNAGPAMGVEGFATFRPKIALPAVAIGGIKAGHTAEIMRAGADGVAVVSAICAAEDPRAAAEDFARAVASARVS